VGYWLSRSISEAGSAYGSSPRPGRGAAAANASFRSRRRNPRGRVRQSGPSCVASWWPQAV